MKLLFPDNNVNEGKCMLFAYLLKNIYPEGQIWDDQNHVIFKLQDKFYDITGEVQPGNHLPYFQEPSQKRLDEFLQTFQEPLS